MILKLLNLTLSYLCKNKNRNLLVLNWYQVYTISWFINLPVAYLGCTDLAISSVGGIYDYKIRAVYVHHWRNYWSLMIHSVYMFWVLSYLCCIPPSYGFGYNCICYTGTPFKTMYFIIIYIIIITIVVVLIILYNKVWCCKQCKGEHFLLIFDVNAYIKVLILRWIISIWIIVLEAM